MFNALRAVGLSALVTASAAAALTGPPSAAAGPRSAPAGQPARATAATGRIVSYDDTTRTLVLGTEQGDQRFRITSDTRVQESAQTIPASTLSSLAGHAAKVRYTVSENEKIAESVMVSGDAEPKPKK